MIKKYLIKKLLYFFTVLFLISGINVPVKISKAQSEIKPGDVVINEVMWMGSDGDTYDEWIELKNTTNKDISLEGWRLTKNTGTETNLKIDFSGKIISKTDYFIISYRAQEKSKLAINPDVLCQTAYFLSNDNLKITLYDNNSQIIDIAGDGNKPFFPSSSSIKASMERNDIPGDGTKKENWHTATASVNFDAGATEKGTPKAPNSLPPSSQQSQESQIESDEEQTSLISIKEARQKTRGAEILIEGWVTVIPGIFSNHYFYIQDKTAGIQIYFSKENWPNLSVGQKIRVLGEISESYNEKRIKISQINDISVLKKEKEPTPLILKTGQIQENYEGILVRVFGKVAEPSGNTFYLDDGSGKIKIYIKKEAKIEKPRLKQGEELQITGIVSQYKDTYRILPRQTEDLKTASGEILIKAKQKTVETDEENNETTNEEIAESTESAERKIGENKVLGAFTQKSKKSWWWILFGTVILCGGGYLGYDYLLQKRTGNSKIWSKISPTLKRWRNYWANWRSRRR